MVGYASTSQLLTGGRACLPAGSLRGTLTGFSLRSPLPALAKSVSLRLRNPLACACGIRYLRLRLRNPLACACGIRYLSLRNPLPELAESVTCACGNVPSFFLRAKREGFDGDPNLGASERAMYRIVWKCLLASSRARRCGRERS